MTDNQQIDNELLDTATDPRYADLLKDYAEMGIDQLVDNEIVKEIPFIKTLVAGGQAIATIKDRIFLQKLAQFFAEANKLTAEERAQWVEKMKAENPKVQKKIAEKLIIVVDSVNDTFKAAVVGKLFRAYAAGRIETYEELFYLIELVDSCMTGVLKNLSEGKEVNDDALYRAGIKHSTAPNIKEISEALDNESRMARRGMSGGQLSTASPSYTNAGKLLIDILKKY